MTSTSKMGSGGGGGGGGTDVGETHRKPRLCTLVLGRTCDERRPAVHRLVVQSPAVVVVHMYADGGDELAADDYMVRRPTGRPGDPCYPTYRLSRLHPLKWYAADEVAASVSYDVDADADVVVSCDSDDLWRLEHVRFDAVVSSGAATECDGGCSSSSSEPRPPEVAVVSESKSASASPRLELRPAAYRAGGSAHTEIVRHPSVRSVGTVLRGNDIVLRVAIDAGAAIPGILAVGMVADPPFIDLVRAERVPLPVPAI